MQVYRELPYGNPNPYESCGEHLQTSIHALNHRPEVVIAETLFIKVLILYIVNIILFQIVYTPSAHKFIQGR